MTSLVLKLLLKAAVPLVLALGAVSYGQYLRGGDPGATLARVGGGALERVAGLGREARDGAGRAAGAAAGGGPGRGTEVRVWTDAHGTVHYANAGPVPDGARTLRVDPDVNVLAPPPAAARTSGAGRKRGAEASATPEPPPGIAGMVGGAGGGDPERARALLEALRGR